MHLTRDRMVEARRAPPRSWTLPGFSASSAPLGVGVLRKKVGKHQDPSHPFCIYCVLPGSRSLIPTGLKLCLVFARFQSCYDSELILLKFAIDLLFALLLPHVMEGDFCLNLIPCCTPALQSLRPFCNERCQRLEGDSKKHWEEHHLSQETNTKVPCDSERKPVTERPNLAHCRCWKERLQVSHHGSRVSKHEPLLSFEAEFHLQASLQRV